MGKIIRLIDEEPAAGWLVLRGMHVSKSNVRWLTGHLDPFLPTKRCQQTGENSFGMKHSGSKVSHQSPVQLGK